MTYEIPALVALIALESSTAEKEERNERQEEDGSNENGICEPTRSRPGEAAEDQTTSKRSRTGEEGARAGN